MIKLEGIKILSHVTTCSRCGRVSLVDNLKENSRTKYYCEKYSLCPECAVWTNISRHGRSHLHTVNGTCYRVFPWVDSTETSFFDTLGGNGKTRYMLMPSEGSHTLVLSKSNDVWKVGKVPPSFRKDFPDTAWWCDKALWQKLEKTGWRCGSRVCLDRYKCLRYKYELEWESGAWNTPPKNWKTGDECCKNFININLVEGYRHPSKPETDAAKAVNKKKKKQ